MPTFLSVQCTYIAVHIFSFQSPARALKVEAGKENPNLTDNWDDAEGYYSKMVICCICIVKLFCRLLVRICKVGI